MLDVVQVNVSVGVGGALTNVRPVEVGLEEILVVEVL